MKTVIDFMGGVFAIAMFAGLMWLCVFATPCQSSAEADYVRDVMGCR